MEILQALYDSEINSSISTFYDGGFNWVLGDSLNGWKATGNTGTLEEAVAALSKAALEYFPYSDFAKQQSSPAIMS